MARFKIDLAEVADWDSFHTTFQQVMKFFEGYGRNMNAWIDCMTDLHGDRALSGHQLPDDEAVELVLLGAEDFGERCPKIAASLAGCTAFANRRYEAMGSAVRIALILE